MKGDKRASDRPPVLLDGSRPLVVPVMSAAGGVGRSTVTAQLAVALHQGTTDSGRAVGVLDCQPRNASPWTGWLDHAAEHGTGWLAAATDEELKREIPRSTSAIEMPAGKPLWVLADTGPFPPSAGGPEFTGADPGPAGWEPVLRHLRAAVIDADSLEGFRLARQQAGGRPSTAAAWMALPSVRTAAVWVTDSSPAGLSRTLEAMSVAEACGLSMGQIVVAISDCRGHGWMPRSRSRRMLLDDRVGAIVEMGHDATLRRDDWPCRTPEQLSRRDVAALAGAVLTTAEAPAAGLTAIRNQSLAGRSSVHVTSTACAAATSG